MTTEIIDIQRSGKLKFFAVYALSLALILFLFSWLRQGTANASVTTQTPQPEQIVKTTDNDLVQADEMLHQKTDALNKLYSSAQWQSSDKNSSKEAIRLAETDFTSSLDSLDKKAALLSDEQQKQKWQSLITSFKTNYYSRNALYANYTQAKNTIPSSNNTDNKQETDALRNTINEKDRLIVSLQTKLNEKPLVTASNSNDSEWKSKYVQQKALTDKLNSQVGELKKSYQIIIEDNKRLLAKIQNSKQ